MEKKNWNYKVFVVGDLNEKLIDFKGADKEMWVETLFIDNKEYTIDEFNKLVSNGVNATIEIAKQYLTEYKNGNYKNWSDNATKVNVTEVYINTENDTPLYINQKHLAAWLTNYFKMHKEEIGFNRPIEFVEYSSDRVLLMIG